MPLRLNRATSTTVTPVALTGCCRGICRSIWVSGSPARYSRRIRSGVMGVTVKRALAVTAASDRLVATTE